MTVPLRCPRCGEAVEALVPVLDAFCGRCAVPLEQEDPSEENQGSEG
jgi:NMD protein affecting ribosome stability and mRNA decay